MFISITFFFYKMILILYSKKTINNDVITFNHRDTTTNLARFP